MPSPWAAGSAIENFTSAGWLGADGRAPNDPGDQDDGEKGLQNYPKLAARPAGFIVDGRLSSKPNATYDVDIYRSASCNPLGHGEGRDWVWSETVTTDGAGQVAVTIDLTGLAVSGTAMTATATFEGRQHTSEFSNCVVMAAADLSHRLYLPVIIR